MADVISARRAYEEAQQAARTLVKRARLRLGQAILDARRRDVSQDAIAKELGLTREQVRRFQREYETESSTGVEAFDSSAPLFFTEVSANAAQDHPVEANPSLDSSDS